MKSKVWTIVLSAVIAFGLWMYVITVERTETEQTFYNVPVILDGESVLQERGLKITSDKDLSVTLKLSGSRSALNKLRSSDITVLVDLTRIYEAGEKTLPYTVSFPGDIQNGAIEIMKREPDSVSLTVAQWDTKSIPVEADPVGTPAPGFLIDEQNMTTDYKSVTISGPKELIAQIEMAKVTVDMTDKTESVERREKLTLCDKDGNPVVADLSSVVVDPYMILTKVPILMEREITLKVDLKDGGGLKKTDPDVKLTMSFDKITVVGNPAVVSKMDPVIELPSIDLGQVNESLEGMLIDIPLPEGVSSREGDKVEVSLIIPEMKTVTRYIPKTQFEKIGVPRDYTAEITTGGLTITLRGRADVMDKIYEVGIRVIVDVEGKTTSDRYKAKIIVGSTEGVGAIENPQKPYEVYVELTKTESVG